jgi:hypothetical protein
MSLPRLILMSIVASFAAPAAAEEELYDVHGPEMPPGSSYRTEVEASGKGIRDSYSGDGKVLYESKYDVLRKMNAIYTFDKVEGRRITNYRIRYLNDELTYTTYRDDQERVDHKVNPMVGRVVVAERGLEGWTNRLAEGEPGEAEAASLKRVMPPDEEDWFPKKKIRIGATWKVPPAFVARGYVEDRDLAATGEVTSTLLEIRPFEGQLCAVIKTEGPVRGTFTSEGRKATFELKFEETEFRSLRHHKALKLDSRCVTSIR